MGTCIVTGAGSGIGWAAAIQISQLGEFDKIVLIGRRQKNLLETKELLKTGTNAYVYVFDLQNTTKIPELIKDIQEKCESIDCLVNVAGYTDPKFLFETSLENIEKTFSVNVFAPYILCKECARMMKNSVSVSKIINIASTAGSTPRPGWSVYAMSKAAVIEMSLTLSEELAPYGIKVYCLSPGRCATDLRKKLAPDEDQSKIMQPEVVGREIARMASQQENCLDGQDIIIRKKF